jgi:hypothetical protein
MVETQYRTHNIDNVSRGNSVITIVSDKTKAIKRGLVIAENAAGIAKDYNATMAAMRKP